jgi:hypothetical protein
MSIKAKIKDATTGNVVEMEFEPYHAVDDVIRGVTDYFNKDTGAYVLRRGKKVMRGGAKLKELKVKKEEVFELIPDPEGG